MDNQKEKVLKHVVLYGSARVTHHPGFPIQDLRVFLGCRRGFSVQTKGTPGESGWLAPHICCVILSAKNSY